MTFASQGAETKIETGPVLSIAHSDTWSVVHCVRGRAPNAAFAIDGA